MRKYLFTLIFLLNAWHILAQNDEGKSDDNARIVLNAFVSDQVEGLTASVKANLTNKLNQIASENGLSGSSWNPRFILTPNVVVLTKDITPTAPPMHAYTLELTLYVGDGIDGVKFANESVTLKGVGINETKAYTIALQGIKPTDPALQALVEKGKKRIIEYYNTRCDFIIKEAQMLESQNKFDEAIFRLTTVPEVCFDCYTRCMDAVGPIFQKLIDRDCQIRLAEARNRWAASPDASGANAVANLLALIEPNSACFAEAQTLASTVSQRMLQIDGREWDFKLRTEIDLQSQRIEAARAVGVAYGENQPDLQYNIRTWW